MRHQTIPATTHQPLNLVSILTRLEGLALFGSAIAFYYQQGFSWPIFFLLLLAPDLAALAYLMNKTAGNRAYNLAHTLLFPMLLGMVSLWFGNALGLQLALIWLTHIGMDRAVGYHFKME